MYNRNWILNGKRKPFSASRKIWPSIWKWKIRGSLEGLRSHLEREQYDVVYLSGHAGIAKDGSPYFIMEDEFGNRRQVSPDELWNEALIENPPRLLFLSGCRTGETRLRTAPRKYRCGFFCPFISGEIIMSRRCWVGDVRCAMIRLSMPGKYCSMN